MWAGVPQKGWVVSLWVNLGKWMSSEKQALEKSRTTQRCEQKSCTFSSPGCTPLCLPGLAKRSFLRQAGLPLHAAKCLRLYFLLCFY